MSGHRLRAGRFSERGAQLRSVGLIKAEADQIIEFEICQVGEELHAAIGELIAVLPKADVGEEG